MQLPRLADYTTKYSILRQKVSLVLRSAMAMPTISIEFQRLTNRNFSIPVSRVIGLAIILHKTQDTCNRLAFR